MRRLPANLIHRDTYRNRKITYEHTLFNIYSKMCFFFFKKVEIMISILTTQVKKSSDIKYMFIILCIVIFVVLGNIIGLVPFNFTITSHVSTTFSISLGLFIGIILLGFYLHKLDFFQLFLPSATPDNRAIIVSLYYIELISFLSRIFSLSIRLFANISAGHILLKILSGSIFFCMEQNLFFVSVISILFGFIVKVCLISFINLFFILEVGIALLQAYIFIVLSSIYLLDGLYPKH